MRKDKCLVCNDPLNFEDGPDTCNRCAGAQVCMETGHHYFENYDLIDLIGRQDVQFICASCGIVTMAVVLPTESL